MDRLEELVIFRAIAETGSLAKASRRLGVSPPTVSRALASLEERVHVRLVERNTRRIAITVAGRDLADRAGVILAGYEEAMDCSGEGPIRGLLRITAPRQFGRLYIAPAILSFLDLNPEIRVELMLNDHNVDLIEEHLDIAVRIGTLPDSNLIARQVGQVRWICVASPAYLRDCGTPEDPLDLSKHQTIFGALYADRHEWPFGPDEQGRLVELEPKLLVNDMDGTLLAARAGKGIARVLSYQALDDLESGRLVRILSEFEKPPLPVNVVMPSVHHILARRRIAADFLVAMLRQDSRLKRAADLAF